ncbi:MAG: winged helix-turn-helix transcriptional regulator [Methylococcales bacterium]|nr:winged helix-turn-helix transcriptional regulator [Methylococcales bacterium]
MQETNTLQIFDRICTIMRADERKKYASAGLQPVHGQVLEYLSICNSFSNTLISVSEYLNLTKGTVSQSIQVLQRKGYLKKQQDEKDRRITHLKLLPAGKRLLEECKPVDLFNQTSIKTTPESSTALTEFLNKTLSSLQKANKIKTFGICHTCLYFSTEGDYYHCSGSDISEYIILSAEINKICKEHIPNNLTN